MTPTTKLTDAQRRVLSRLAHNDDKTQGALSGPDLEFMCPRTTGRREWGRSILNRLEKKGLVRKAGISISGAQCFVVTPLGVHVDRKISDQNP